VPGYEIQDVLGRGGMGIVYLARDRRLDRLVALKMMLPTAEPTERSRFRTEALAVARLQHPHIVQIYEVGEHDGLPYFALEYVEGGNLRDKLADIPLSADQAARLVEVISRAVHFAHQRGIIHRDLKPANILLAPNPKSESHSSENNGALAAPTLESEFRISEFIPKVADFGLAKRLDQDSGQTRTGALVGTPSYMAPEQAVGKNQEIGPATDVYALGALLYALLTGRPPFQAATVLETLEQVRLQEPVRPTQLQPKVPRDLETICLKCLQKEPRKRYAGAEALAEDLRRFLAGEPIRARPTPFRERGLKWVKRRPMAAALAAVVTLAAASLIAGAFLYQGQRTRAAEANARIAERELRDYQRLDAIRSETKDLLVQADLAKAKEDWPKVRVLLDQAEAKVRDETVLSDLLAHIQDFLVEVQQREKLRELVRKFSTLYDETTIHLTPFTGADLPANLEAGRQTALKALALFGVAPGEANPPAFDSAFTPEEQALVKAGSYELLLFLAESHAKEEPRHAVDILDQANQLGLHTKAYHIRRARYLRLLQDPSAADEEKGALRQGAVSALDHFLIAVDLRSQGMLPAAIREFEETLRLQPDHFWAHYFLAVCHLQEHRVSDLRIAKLHLDSCIRQKNFEWAHLLRGWTQTELGEFAAADQDFSAALNSKPDDKDVHYAVLVNRGVLRARQADYLESLTGWPLFFTDFAQAENNFNEAIRLKPDSYQAYMHLAKAYQRQNNLAAAVEQLGKAINTARPLVNAERLESSALIRLYLERAELHRKRNDLNAALADLDLAFKVEPHGSKSEILAVAHADRGRILLSRKDYAGAVDAYDTALGIRDSYADAHLGRAEALFEQREFEEATRSYDRHFKHGGKPAAAIFRKRAQAQAQLHKYAEAIADYTLALRLEARADTYANRGWIYVVNGAIQAALDDFEEAIRRDPKNGDAHNGRGLMRAKLGRSGADDDAHKALDLGPLTARHVWSAARIYAELAGRIDTDRDRRRNQALMARFDYQHQAAQLLRQALGLMSAEEHASFWRGKIEGDKTFDSIRSSVGYAKLRAEFAPNK
jgi:tetratricopeptide (TPR) repeat protein